MSKSNKVENKNGTSVEMLDAFKRQHMIVRNFNALTLSRTFSPSLLFLFSTFSFFGIFMFRHFYFRPKLGLPFAPFHTGIIPFASIHGIQIFLTGYRCLYKRANPNDFLLPNTNCHITKRTDHCNQKGSGIFYRLNYIKSKIKMSKTQRSKIKNVESNCTSFVTRLIYDKQRYTEIQIALTILTHLLSTFLTALTFRTLTSIIHQNSMNYSLVIVFM